MLNLHCCPICNDLRIRTILEHYKVTAQVEGKNREVQSLVAFTCEHGHIFFLRRTDLVEPLPPRQKSDFARR